MILQKQIAIIYDCIIFSVIDTNPDTYGESEFYRYLKLKNIKTPYSLSQFFHVDISFPPLLNYFIENITHVKKSLYDFVAYIKKYDKFKFSIITFLFPEISTEEKLLLLEGKNNFVMLDILQKCGFNEKMIGLYTLLFSENNFIEFTNDLVNFLYTLYPTILDLHNNNLDIIEKFFKTTNSPPHKNFMCNTFNIPPSVFKKINCSFSLINQDAEHLIRSSGTIYLIQGLK